RMPAFLFDMDGVIIDSTRTHTAAWHQYLAGHGIALEDVEARMLGKHNDAIVREFFRSRELTPEEIFRHGAGKEAVYRERMAPMVMDRLIPGVTSFLRQWRDIPKAVATNGERANVEFVLERSNLRQYFQAVLSGDDVERPKPAPDIYLRAAEMLGANPLDCIVFEDSIPGVEAARNAGMRVIGLTTTLHDLPGVDLTIAHFLEPALETWLATTAFAI
ncbi:MAG: HAD family phosphatase, partial [Opitutaceae bacterium]|nr:HAD family phosphatase [Verrucomicrobiales bacterium]